MEPILVSVRVACGLLGIKKTKLFELLRDHHLERRKIGGKTLVTYSSVLRLAEASTSRMVRAYKRDHQQIVEITK